MLTSMKKHFLETLLCAFVIGMAACGDNKETQGTQTTAASSAATTAVGTDTTAPHTTSVSTSATISPTVSVTTSNATTKASLTTGNATTKISLTTAKNNAITTTAAKTNIKTEAKPFVTTAAKGTFQTEREYWYNKSEKGYWDIRLLTQSWEGWQDDEKGLIEKMKEEKEHQRYNLCFDGNQFYSDSTNLSTHYYTGTYSKDSSNRITFSYDSVIGIVMNGIRKGSEYKVTKNDSPDGTNNILLYELKHLNESGKLEISSTSPASSDYGLTKGLLPVTLRRFNSTATLNVWDFGDVLCTDAYGMELDGKYSAGRAFTINYNIENVYLDDKLSDYYTKNWSEEELKKNIGYLMKYLSVVPKTTIQFSDGKWTWQTVGGQTISSGQYHESSLYKGAIIMKSDNYDYGLQQLYIDKDGKIYTLFMVRDKL